MFTDRYQKCKTRHNRVLYYSLLFNQSINQSINLYRTIVQRRVLQCGYAESKRNVLRRILNVLTNGSSSTVQWKIVPESLSSNRETTSSSVQVVQRNWQKFTILFTILGDTVMNYNKWASTLHRHHVRLHCYSIHTFVHISLRKLLVIIDRMVAMCLPVLSTLTRRLITLTTGFCSVN